MITKGNYEAYLLDLWEGTISPEDREALMSFLEKHPELDVDLDEEMPQLEKDMDLDIDTSSFDFREVTSENRELFFIAYQEGELTKTEQQQVQEFLKHHPEHQGEFDSFQKTVLTAPDIQFNNKKSLNFGRSNTKWVWRIAATLLILLGGYSALEFLNLDSTTAIESQNNQFFADASFKGQGKNWDLSYERNPQFSENETVNTTNKTTDFSVEKNDKGDLKSNSVLKEVNNINALPKRKSNELATTDFKKQLYVPTFNIKNSQETNKNAIQESLKPESQPQELGSYLLAFAKDKLKKEEDSENKETGQTLVAMGVNKGLDFITGEDQTVAMKEKSGKKHTFLKFGDFSFERISASK